MLTRIIDWYSAIETLSSCASSVSVGARPSRCSSLCIAVSMRRSALRVLRGSQSFCRSSSSMAPRMRWVAYVSNWLPWLSSKRCAASMRPIIPAWMVSWICTLDGRRAAR